MKKKIKLNSCNTGHFNSRNHSIITMYSAPIIDILNGLAGALLPIGVVLRTLICAFNLFFYTKSGIKKNRRLSLLIYGIIVYLMLHSVCIGYISGGIGLCVSHAMKLVLFLSEVLLIASCIDRKKITYVDIRAFLKFSCWFVPVSLMVAKVIGLSNYANYSMAGLYSSVNAMSIVFIVLFSLSIMFARTEKVNWFAVLLNMIAVLLLGTKSPYLYIAAITVALLLFYSKHRLRTFVLLCAGVVLTYFVLTKYYSNQLAKILNYQSHMYSAAKKNDAIWGYLLSGRNAMLDKVWNGIEESGLVAPALLFGIGVSNLSSGLEMDFFEILFSYGMFAVAVIYIIPIKAMKWRGVNRNDDLFLNIILICIVSFSILGGHTFTEAIAATYSAILIGYKYSLRRNKDLKSVLISGGCSH